MSYDGGRAKVTGTDMKPLEGFEGQYKFVRDMGVNWKSVVEYKKMV